MQNIYKQRSEKILTRHSTQMPQYGSRVIWEDIEVPSMSEERRQRILVYYLLRKQIVLLIKCHLPDSSKLTRAVRDTHFENGSDFPVGKPLPCVLVSTFPQCTATWQSLCSTILQYSCCKRKMKKGKPVRGSMHETGRLSLTVSRAHITNFLKNYFKVCLHTSYVLHI